MPRLHSQDLPARPTTTVLAVEPRQCRWPYGHPGQSDFGLCGRQKTRGAYCDAHAAIGYQRRPVRLESLYVAGLE